MTRVSESVVLAADADGSKAAMLARNLNYIPPGGGVYAAELGSPIVSFRTATRT